MSTILDICFISSKRHNAVAFSQKVGVKKSAEPHLDSARFLQIAVVLKKGIEIKEI